MESPHNGYQALSVNIHALVICPLGTSFDPDREILAMMNHNSTKTTEFLNLWSNLGLQPNHHFFLVFQLDPLSPYYTAPIITLAIQSASSIYFYPPQALSHSDCGSRSPASTGSPSPDEGSQHSIALEQLLHSIPGISKQQFQDTYFLRDQPLFHSIKNWNSITHIIEEAKSLSEHISEDTILHHFSWATTSYWKKKRLFTWVKEASEKEWSGSTLIGKALHFSFTFLFAHICIMPIALFGTWRGIVYIWGHGGALESDQEPRKGSSNSDKKQAAMLTQDNIEKNKMHIMRYFCQELA